ncbi:MAG: DUF1292 domain-containing protein [Bacilli bacterium]
MSEQIITVINNLGVEVRAEVLNAFSSKKTGEKYCVYTLNEQNENGMIQIYIAKLVKENNDYILVGIESDEEWSFVKELMKSIAKGE